MLKAKLELTESADVLSLGGDLAGDTMKNLGEIVLKLALRRNHPLIVDMSDLEFIDSRGAAFLVGLRNNPWGKVVAFACVPYTIEKVLTRIFVVDKLINFKSVDEAHLNLRSQEEDDQIIFPVLQTMFVFEKSDFWY